jgi:hypothetical protein
MAYYNSHQTRKKIRVVPELVKEKKIHNSDTPDNTKKNRWSIFKKTHKLNKKSTTYKRRHKAQNHTKRKYNNKIINVLIVSYLKRGDVGDGDLARLLLRPFFSVCAFLRLGTPVSYCVSTYNYVFPETN